MKSVEDLKQELSSLCEDRNIFYEEKIENDYTKSLDEKIFWKSFQIGLRFRNKYSQVKLNEASRGT